MQYLRRYLIMPKSFLYAVRDYRYGYYCGGSEQGVNVMTTRSGLSIKKVGSNSKPSTSSISQPPPKDDQRTTSMKTRQRKRHKSVSEISFVMRYYMKNNMARFENSRLSLEDYFLTTYPLTEKSDIVDSSDDEEDTYLDGFILSASENLNNNQTTNSQNILEQKESWLADTVNVEKAKITNPLVKYFEDNRLPDIITLHPSDTSLLNVSRQYGEDKRFIIKNQIQEDDKKSNESESDDTTSSVSSDVFSNLDNAPLAQLTPADHDEKSSVETKLLKLRDAQLKVQLVKSTDGQRMIKCRECNRIFEALSAYIVHLRLHSKSKSTCFLCGKAFSRSWLLKGHMRTHTGERPFTCPHKGCNKSFADKSNLRSHTLIHDSTKKNHKCSKCGRSFAQKRYLHKHMQEVCRVFLQ